MKIIVKKGVGIDLIPLNINMLISVKPGVDFFNCFTAPISLMDKYLLVAQAIPY